MPIITALMDVKRAHDSDGSQNKVTQAAERKRQAFEVAPGDHVRQKAIKYKDLGTVIVVNGATYAPVHFRPVDSKIWQTGNVATPSHHGTGHAHNLCFPTTEVQAAQRSIMEEAALVPAKQAATYMPPFLETSLHPLSETRREAKRPMRALRHKLSPAYKHQGPSHKPSGTSMKLDGQKMTGKGRQSSQSTMHLP